MTLKKLLTCDFHHDEKGLGTSLSSDSPKFIRAKKVVDIHFHHDEKNFWGTSLSSDSPKFIRAKKVVDIHFHHDEKTFLGHDFEKVVDGKDPTSDPYLFDQGEAAKGSSKQAHPDNYF